MNDVDAEIALLARELKTPVITTTFAALAAQARAEAWSHETYLAAVLARQVASRNVNGSRLRVSGAHFPQTKTFEDFVSLLRRGGGKWRRRRRGWWCARIRAGSGRWRAGGVAVLEVVPHGGRPLCRWRERRDEQRGLSVGEGGAGRELKEVERLHARRRPRKRGQHPFADRSR